MKRTRTPKYALLTSVAAAGALLLAACSSAGPERPDAAASGAASYTVEHAMGETAIDGAPERVVVIDSPHLDALLTLGVTPVGATESGAGEGFPGYLADRLGDTETVGLTAEPDIDAIAQLAPDLIIGSKVRHEAIYDQLSALAPTVFSEGSGTNWTEQALITAAAVGRSDEMSDKIDALSQRAAAIGERFDVAGTSASMVRFRPDNFRLYGPETFSGSILEDVGFDLGERDWNEYSMMELSPENYGEIDGDIVFYTNPGGDPKATTMAAVQDLWSEQPAVRGGQTHEVEDETWMVGIGVTGGGLILDELESALG